MIRSLIKHSFQHILKCGLIDICHYPVPKAKIIASGTRVICLIVDL